MDTFLFKPHLHRLQRFAVCLGLLLISACSLNDYSSSYQIPASGAYRIQPGDTLYRIARRYGLNYKELARWNGIPPPYRIYVGKTLYLRPSAVKTVSRSSSSKTITSSQNSTIEKKSKKKLKIFWQWPLKGVIAKRYSPPESKGIDIAASLGDEVRAAATGKVVYSGKGYVGYDNLIIIKHSEDFLSAYANNRTLQVQEGEMVKVGQVIAVVGAHSGRPASLHFEIRKNSQPDNPLKYLPSP